VAVAVLSGVEPVPSSQFVEEHLGEPMNLSSPCAFARLPLRSSVLVPAPLAVPVLVHSIMTRGSDTYARLRQNHPFRSTVGSPLSAIPTASEPPLRSGWRSTRCSVRTRIITASTRRASSTLQPASS